MSSTSWVVTVEVAFDRERELGEIAVAGWRAFSVAHLARLPMRQRGAVDAHVVRGCGSAGLRQELRQARAFGLHVVLPPKSDSYPLPDYSSASAPGSD